MEFRKVGKSLPLANGKQRVFYSVTNQFEDVMQMAAIQMLPS